MFLLWLTLLVHSALPTLLIRVSDNSGKPVPHADVLIITSDGNTIARSTDERGSVRIEISGRFRIAVRRVGFRPLRTSLITLSAEGLYHVDIPLVLGDLNDVPEDVEAQTQELQDIQNRIDPSAREALPKADRLFGLRGGVNVSGIREGAGQEWLATTGNVFTNSSLATTVQIGRAACRE